MFLTRNVLHPRLQALDRLGLRLQGDYGFQVRQRVKLPSSERSGLPGGFIPPTLPISSERVRAVITRLEHGYFMGPESLKAGLSFLVDAFAAAGDPEQAPPGPWDPWPSPVSPEDRLHCPVRFRDWGREDWRGLIDLARRPGCSAAPSQLGPRPDCRRNAPWLHRATAQAVSLPVGRSSAR